MIRRPRTTPVRQLGGDGIVWPGSGTTTPPDVGDVFGPRPFSPHLATVGYDYDFHRGIDIPAVQDSESRTPVYSPVRGAVIRRHYAHFPYSLSDYAGAGTDWDDQFEELDPDGIVSVQALDELNLSYNLAPTVSDSSAIASGRLRNRTPVQLGGSEDCDLRVWLTGSLSNLNGSGAFGILLHDEETDEHVAIDYDSATLRFSAVDADGADTINGTSSSVADINWLRIFWDASAGNILLQYSTTDDRDPGSWTTAATFTAPNFTSAGIHAFRWSMFVRKLGTSESGSIPIGFLGCVDESEDIGRFGNWLMISDGENVWVLMHLCRIEVNIGDVLTRGQLVGYMGREGFDDRSGPILQVHVHVEVIPGNVYFYNNDSPVNPLASGLLPRTDSTSNVSISRTEMNDPNGDPSHRIRVTVTRGDQDFDLNEVGFTGDSATRTVNFDTRSGLNTDNDVPDQDGVYIVPSAFDEDSATYVCDFYFQKSVVGNNAVSYYAKDCNGITLQSE